MMSMYKENWYQWVSEKKLRIFKRYKKLSACDNEKGLDYKVISTGPNSWGHKTAKCGFFMTM